MSTIPAKIKGAATASKREFYLDWIRNFVVLILVPFHTSVSFSHIGKGYVYTAAPVDSWFYFFISDFFNLWIMRLLFFISGISVFMSLKKRTMVDFVIDRFKRLILPVLFLLFTLGPLAGYILAITRYNFSNSFLIYYPQFFIQGKKYLFWGHMWYCVYLFIFSLMFLPLFSLLLKKPTLIKKINSFLVCKNYIFLPMLVIIFFETLLRPFYPGYQSFIGDWANVTVHSSFFILGFIMAQSSELFDMITRKIKTFLIPAICSTILYLVCKRFLFVEETYCQLLIQSSLWGIAAYTWVFSFIGLFRKYWNRNNPLLRYLSKTSFSLYLFHYLLLSILNYFLLKTDLPHYLVWSITSLGTYILFIILFEVVLKKIKPIRYICGIQK